MSNIQTLNSIYNHLLYLNSDSISKTYFYLSKIYYMDTVLNFIERDNWCL